MYISFIFVLFVNLIIFNLISAQSLTNSNFTFEKGEIILNSKNSSDYFQVLAPTPHIPGFKNEGRLLVGEGSGSFLANTLTGDDNKGYNNLSSNAFFKDGWYRTTTGFESWSLSNYVTNNDTGYFSIYHASPESTSKINNFKPLLTLNSKGTLYVKELIVTNSWADYVFNKDYKLMPLNEVAEFINKNNHLPNIPSEAEIQSNGISVGEMQQKQMEKIEELTLYVIDLNKKNNELELQIQELKTLINKL